MKKMRPGLYRIDNFRIEFQPSDEYEKSKPWIVVDEGCIPPNPIGRERTLKKAIEQVEIIKNANQNQ